ncbi:acetyltransferase (GNAT) family protein [Herbihabitans rhizosphaerae]|uniref:Acetyltransferase (GNAT) family protein n=1 Tax=Herbihabitans rhizosphaerae TaxID=1872711 RepID=A0A4Q7KP91_9PSEU|nr:GNAT family protein [Herbihabitans rhizosphaerae]RZS37072.1 acetyltransferase (GNAT) family protein [Herbihabitans rhizosphaerae]
MSRTVVASRDGIALAEFAEGDDERLDGQGDGAFDVERDDREKLVRQARGRLVVLAEAGELLGDVSWHAVTYGPNYRSQAWNIGISLLPSARGRGAGGTALALLVEHLFATTDLDRVEASTDVDNVVAQRAAAKAGLRREGVLRGAQLRGGERRDMVLFAVLRSDL